MKITISPVRSIRFTMVNRGRNGKPGKVVKGRPIMSARKAAEEWAREKNDEWEYRTFALPNGDEYPWDFMTDADFSRSEMRLAKLERRVLPIFRRILDAK